MIDAVQVCSLGAIGYTSVSQTVVREPQVVLGFCPCGPFRLNISPKKQVQSMTVLLKM